MLNEDELLGQPVPLVPIVVDVPPHHARTARTVVAPDEGPKDGSVLTVPIELRAAADAVVRPVPTRRGMRAAVMQCARTPVAQGPEALVERTHLREKLNLPLGGIVDYTT
jgi:hypothetical protein